MSLLLSTTDSSTISRRPYRHLENMLWTTSCTSALACSSCGFISFKVLVIHSWKRNISTHSCIKLMKIIARCLQMDTAFYTNRLEPFINTTFRT